MLYRLKQCAHDLSHLEFDEVGPLRVDGSSQ